MKNKQIQKLKQKGWSEKDIMRTEEIINARHKFDKSRTVVHMSRIIYWTALLVIVIGNFVISMVLIPFLLVLNKFSLDIN